MALHQLQRPNPKHEKRNAVINYARHEEQEQRQSNYVYNNGGKTFEYGIAKRDAGPQYGTGINITTMTR